MRLERKMKMQMKVAIIGANGGVGTYLSKILVKGDNKVVGFIRNLEQAEALENLGIETRLADLMETSVEDYARLLEDIDAIVFTAGAGGAGVELTKAVDGEGVRKMIAAAKMAEVNRFILVSVFPDAGRDQETTDSFETYMKVKRQADVDLTASKLAWTILRPGTLTDNPGSGQVNLGHAIPYGEVSREDVASVIAELLKHPETAYSILELTEGDLTIEDAVLKLNRMRL